MAVWVTVTNEPCQGDITVRVFADQAKAQDQVENFARKFGYEVVDGFVDSDLVMSDDLGSGRLSWFSAGEDGPEASVVGPLEVEG